MPISTWIRDLFGIRKDAVDTKKAKLEITKLEAEERERNLITPASLNDIKEYDPKYRRIREHREKPTPRYLQQMSGRDWLIAILCWLLFWAILLSGPILRLFKHGLH